MHCIIGIVCLVTVIGGNSNSVDSDVPSGGSGETQTFSQPTLDMLPGIVRPFDAVTLSVTQDGVISEVAVEEGDYVEPGQLLGATDHRVARAAVRLATVSAEQESGVIQARLHLSQSRRYLDRVTHAHRDNAASELEFDQAKANVEQAEQAFHMALQQQVQAQAQLDLEKARLAAHMILAPFSGRVSRITGKVGQSMSRTEPLMQLVNTERLQVVLHIPHQYLGKLQTGNTYALAAEPPVNQQLTAQLQAFEDVIDAGTGTFRCVFTIDNRERQYPAGFSVRLIEPDKQESLRVAASTDAGT